MENLQEGLDKTLKYFSDHNKSLQAQREEAAQQLGFDSWNDFLRSLTLDESDLECASIQVSDDF